MSSPNHIMSSFSQAGSSTTHTTANSPNIFAAFVLARQSNLCRVNAASRSRYSRVKPHPCRVTAASDLVSAASHCTGRVKRHPERQPQLLWSKEELVSGNRKSIYTMPFELIKHIFKIFYPDERGHSNHPDQLLGVGSLLPCYDRSGALFH
ncbi:hypothetical protein BD769DRAFT_1019616 [Suillus cothurnatus]|nr:hypothetical protein BD769DRAFT_1019616 [Suillus cothurnatus]